MEATQEPQEPMDDQQPMEDEEEYLDIDDLDEVEDDGPPPSDLDDGASDGIPEAAKARLGADDEDDEGMMMSDEEEGAEQTPMVLARPDRTV